jgi:hypothetical protein
MALREANVTVAEKQARAEETRRGQILFSRIVPENHPDWRLQENSNFAFYREQITPLEKEIVKVAYLEFSQIACISYIATLPSTGRGIPCRYRARICENRYHVYRS